MRSYWYVTSSTSIAGSAPGGGFEILSVEDHDGRSLMRITGPSALRLFENESGGHRWQRVPPTEKRGRVQTSTVTVAVMEQTRAGPFRLDPRDVEESFVRGSGKGGQKRNKTSSACRLRHVPTGIQVRSEDERSQSQNRERAWAELTRRVKELHDAGIRDATEHERRSQVGSGMRGDKRRTYRERDDTVADHVTGKKASYERVLAGELELLWG